MRINTDTWHYRLWHFSYSLSGTNGDGSATRPTKTSLCQYVARVPLAILVCLAWLLILTALGFAIVATNAFTILSGSGIFRFSRKSLKDDEFLTPFRSLKVGQWQIPMRRAVLSSYGALVVAAVTHYDLWDTLKYAGYGIGGVVALLVAILLFCIVRDGIDTARQWDGWRVLKQYLKDKREGICGSVEFEEAN